MTEYLLYLIWDSEFQISRGAATRGVGGAGRTTPGYTEWPHGADSGQSWRWAWGWPWGGQPAAEGAILGRFGPITAGGMSGFRGRKTENLKSWPGAHAPYGFSEFHLDFSVSVSRDGI